MVCKVENAAGISLGSFFIVPASRDLRCVFFHINTILSMIFELFAVPCNENQTNYFLFDKTIVMGISDITLT
jgi:hypothetical protein